MKRSSSKLLLSLALIVATSFALPAYAQDAPPENFADWTRALEQDAIESGVSPQVAHSVASNIELIPHVIDLDQKQPEKTVTFADYNKRVVSSDRVTAGQKALADNATMLNEVSGRYGVPSEIIVALWGIESSYGHNSGDYSIVNSLATLAYQGRRAAFFRSELIDALHIIDERHIPAAKLRGSWAGAMGECQFMPSTYLHHAASYDGGAPDIWDDSPDVFASIANYLNANGWDSHIPGWGKEVRLMTPIADAEVGLTQKHLLSDWAQMGITQPDGLPMDGPNLEASLIAPDGADGRHFLVYDNYRALMKWNRSTYFATSVGLLADRIK